jgi:multiple sugar transport system permease protein
VTNVFGAGLDGKPEEGPSRWPVKVPALATSALGAPGMAGLSAGASFAVPATLEEPALPAAERRAPVRRLGLSRRPKGRRGPRETGTLRRGEGLFGWLFVSPALAILVLFVVLPILLAFYVSFTNWSGLTPPLSRSVQLVGLANYRQLLTQPGLYQANFAESVRNVFYYVLFTVPLQTALALGLAVLVNNKFLKAKAFFRGAYYLPSVTSSIAITVIFMYLFQGQGVVNMILHFFGWKNTPDWIYDQNGLFTTILSALGVNSPSWGNHLVMGLSAWQWLAGPSIGMCVMIVMVSWTTAGTFMLFFLAALQQINDDIEEASEVDGATAWQRFRRITVPLLRPTLVLVFTLGFISTWQVFDQSFLLGPANPTDITPAFFAYQVSFQDSGFGMGAAIAFLLFGFIVVLTVLQRKFVKEDLTK